MNWPVPESLYSKETLRMAIITIILCGSALTAVFRMASCFENTKTMVTEVHK